LRDDESNQQLLRLYQIERTLIFGRIFKLGRFIYARGMALMLSDVFYIVLEISTELD